MTEAPAEEAVEKISAEEVARLAKSSVLVLTMRTAVIRAIGVVSYLGFARLLSPREFGIASVGLSIVFFSGFLADAGLGAAFIRGATRPTREQLGALIGLQTLVVSVCLIPLIIWAVAGGGADLPIVALLYVVSLIPTAFRIPAVILLERRLDFRAMVVVEIAEVIAFNVIALALLILGVGVAGLAIATIVRAVVGSGMFLHRVPESRIRPNVRLRKLKSALGFGLRSQAGAAVTIGRDQAINSGTAVIASLSTLGVWSLTGRLMLIPSVLSDSLFRVSYPAFARLSETGADVRPALVRTTSLLAVALPLVLIPAVAGGFELIPLMLGTDWRAVPDILPYASLGTAIGIPVAATSTGILWARGEAGLVLRLTVFQAAVLLVLSAALLVPLGATGLAISSAVTSTAATCAVIVVLRNRFEQLALWRPCFSPVILAAAACGVSRLLVQSIDSAVLRGTAAAVVGLVLYAALLGVFERSGATDAIGFLRRMVRRA